MLRGQFQIVAPSALVPDGDLAVTIGGLAEDVEPSPGARSRASSDPVRSVGYADTARWLNLRLPLDEAKLGAVDPHDDIAEPANASQNWFVVPGAVVPRHAARRCHRKPGQAPEHARDRGVENLPADLNKIARSRRVSDRVNMESIAGEVLVVTDGQIRVDAAKEASMAG